MKKILFLLLSFVSYLSYAQDSKVSALPEDTIVHSTDLFYVIDQGTTSKKMTSVTLFDSINDNIHDTADILRSAYNDSIAAVRAVATSGTVGWSQSGTKLYPTATADSIGVGLSAPTAKLDVSGNVRFRNNIYMGTAGYGFSLSGVTTTLNTKLYLTNDLTMGYLMKVIFGYGADVNCYIDRDAAGNLVLHDNITGSKTLAQLVSGGGSGTITGSGTASRIPYWSTDTELDDDEYFVRESNTTRITNPSSTDTGLYVANGNAGSGILVRNGTVTGGGYGISIWNLASGGDAFYINNAGNRGFYINTTVESGNSVEIADDGTKVFSIDYTGSVYLNKFDNDAVDTVGLILYKATGKVDTATIVNAGFGLKKTPLFLKYFTKRVNGELNWPRSEGDSYHDMNAMTANVQLQAGIERAYVWIFRQQIMMILMFAAIVWLVIKRK